MIRNIRKALLLLAATMGLLLASTAAQADPPYRVARLSYVAGGVSFSPVGEGDWSRAVVNRPLMNGDRLWVADRSRAELQLGGTALRFGDESSVAILNIDNRIAQLQLTQGDVEIRVWRMEPNQVVEVDTPNLAVVIRQPGTYRVEVDPQDASTGVTVRTGTALLYGEGRAFRIGPADTWRFYDTRLSDYDTYRSRRDELARWSAQRDQRWERSVSARYVSRDMIGFADLDEYGEWRQVPQYGWVWTPTRVSAEWAPYREGHWSWVEPWGWTWVDDQPWGFAPSHYGRWAHLDQRWVWVPGPVRERPVYAPALVAFIGGAAISAAVGGSNIIGWFPLAPREVYRPSYAVSRDYFTRVNTTNTVLNVTQVVNVYNTRSVTNVYVNQRVPNAIVAVPTQTFVQAKPVAREVVRVQAQNIQPQAIVLAPQAAPAKTSVMGAQPAQQRPPEQAFRKQVVAQTAPPPPPPSVETRAAQVQANAGQPIAPPASAPARGRGNAQAPAPEVKVVQPTQAASAPAAPPAAAASRADREQRREQREQRREERDRNAPRSEAPAAAPAATPATPATPGTATTPTTPATPATPSPGRPGAPPAAASAPAQATPPAASGPDRGRGAERRSEERGQGEERGRGRPELGRPGAASAPAPAGATPPAAAPAATPSAAAPAAPAARSQEAAPAAREQRQQQREERQQQREERRDQPAAPAAGSRPAPAAPAPQAAPQSAPPPAAATPGQAPATRGPDAGTPAARDQRQQQREERQQQREERQQQREVPPAQRPAPQAAPQAAPSAPAPQAAPQAAPQTPPAAPGATARPTAPAAPAASAAEQRRERANARAEERREAASEARGERGERGRRP